MTDQSPTPERPAPRPRPVYGLPAEPKASRPRPVYGLPADPATPPPVVPASGPVDSLPTEAPATDPIPDSTATTPGRPSQIWAAFGLWIAWAVLGLIQVFISWNSGDLAEQFDATMKRFPDLVEASGYSPDTMRASTVLLTIALTIAMEGLLIVLATQLLRGRRWARTVLTVIAAFIVLMNLPMLMGGGLIGVLVATGAILLAYSKPAGAFIDLCSPRRTPNGPSRIM